MSLTNDGHISSHKLYFPNYQPATSNRERNSTFVCYVDTGK